MFEYYEHPDKEEEPLDLEDFPLWVRMYYNIRGYSPSLLV